MSEIKIGREHHLARTPRKLRMKGEVPADYQGPVYYRMHEDVTANRDHTKMRFPGEDARLDKLLHRSNEHREVLTSGLVVDADGELLPEWRTPLKGVLTGPGRPDRVEYNRGTATVVSERVYDAIVSLEPDRHIFVPMDVSSPGGVLRYYAMFVARSHLTEQLLHPAANGLDRLVWPDGRQGWSRPLWLSGLTEEAGHFGYLDGHLIKGLHLFTGPGLDNMHVFSPALFQKLAPFGDIYQRYYTMVPIGVSWDDRAYDPPAKPIGFPPPPPRSFLDRLLGR